MRLTNFLISTSREETANSVSHALGLVAVLIAFPFFIQQFHSRPGTNIGAVIFLIAMALVYLSSTLYHATPEGRLKQLFLKFDYGIIFLFIAASYTAFADRILIDRPLPSVVIWTIAIWSIAIAGIVLKLSDWLSHPLHWVGYYLSFGWITLLAAIGLATYLSHHCIYWLLVGGLFYSVGVVFYLFGTRLRFSHLGWHLLVMLGNGCHCIALFSR